MFNTGDKVKKITDGSIGEVVSIIDHISGVKYQVRFSNGETSYISEDILEACKEIKTPIEAFSNFQFRGIDDYQRIMTFQRFNGGLTNIFYSMKDTFADFLPHQFLPVTKFLQSPEERILIADEVGLGKTVEALYIWKELEARRNAKRLLIVCPASLREKWKRDMQNLFGIHAEIVMADKLLETFRLIEKNRKREQFAYICSLESIRAKYTSGYNKVSELNKAFEEFAANYSEYAFNLTVIDEAHYMRNRDTANFKTGSRLRDISESLVLLSATPIQTKSDNLFSLMNLMAPEQFENQWTFEYMLNKDSGFIKLANCLQRLSSTKEDFEKIILENCHMGGNDLVNEIQVNADQIFSSNEKRMLYAEDLLKQVFYNNLFNRTRRRFVFENTAKRKPNAVKYNLSSSEEAIYNQVTNLIRSMAKGRSEIMTFALIARQRQMASCLPAAFKDWKAKINKTDNDDENEYIYQDDDDLIEFDEDGEASTKRQTYRDLKPFYVKVVQEFPKTQYEDLKKIDSKFEAFLKSIKELLRQNPKEKIIVFSFFRSTNEYLEERLEEEGISAVAIKGGMGELKDILLENFKTDESINVLVSSEVGSEGLDLQFASVEYNYDLPWNPMRLEQRIGRIDRIGQKAPVLRIYNLCCQNTIEDIILERLYERVKIFENSIGDMEDIVGQPVQELALEILDPKLTNDDRKEKAEQKIQVLIEKRMMNNRLEEEAGVLNEYREMVLASIKNADEKKRNISELERVFIVKDFLKNYFPGSAFFQNKDNPLCYVITLSNEAILSFRDFRRKEHLEKFTSIDSGGDCILSFAQKKDEKRKGNVETAALDHPIFDWIKWILQMNPIKASGCSAITIKPNEIINKGNYVYYIQKWKCDGVEKDCELKYFVGCIETDAFLSNDVGEKIMNTLITEGVSLIDPAVRLSDFEPYYDFAKKLINHAWDEFDIFSNNYKKKSKIMYDKQLEFVNYTADKKIEKKKSIIENLTAENKDKRVIKMHNSEIEKINKERELKIKQLEKEQFTEPEVSDMTIGVLIVE